MSETISTEERKKTIIAELNQETSKMPWSEMQKFFASGVTIYVSEEFDLLDVASDLVMDNKSRIEGLMADQKMYSVNDEQATRWLSEDIRVWAVVLAPYILVQPVKLS